MNTHAHTHVRVAYMSLGGVVRPKWGKSKAPILSKASLNRNIRSQTHPQSQRATRNGLPITANAKATIPSLRAWLSVIRSARSGILLLNDDIVYRSCKISSFVLSKTASSLDKGPKTCRAPTNLHGDGRCAVPNSVPELNKVTAWPYLFMGPTS